MPEVITKHPTVTIDVLRSGGARCGEGAPQTILTACPRERFCSTPTGEICVFGLEDVSAMTQISPRELVRAATAAPGGPPPRAPEARLGLELVLILLAIALLVGVLLGLLWAKTRRESTGVERGG